MNVCFCYSGGAAGKLIDKLMRLLQFNVNSLIFTVLDDWQMN